jgi:hypothetical protein
MRKRTVNECIALKSPIESEFYILLLSEYPEDLCGASGPCGNGEFVIEHGVRRRNDKIKA